MIDVNIHEKSKGVYTVTLLGNSYVFYSFHNAVKWVEAMAYGFQPDRCYIYGGACTHPFEHCDNCHMHYVLVDDSI